MSEPNFEIPCINKIVIGGYIGQDPPEVKQVGNSTVATFSVQTAEFYMSGGVEKVATTWHRVEVVGEKAVKAAAELRPNTYVIVEGAISSGQYTNSEGKKSYYTKVKTFSPVKAAKQSVKSGMSDEPPPF